MKVMKFAECGLPWNERFTFYDHIHTTGMDIKQAVDVTAAMTLGKDMVYRDYAQGSFRMRGLGKGQGIRILVVPEILRRIQSQVRVGYGPIRVSSIVCILSCAHALRFYEGGVGRRSIRRRSSP